MRKGEFIAIALVILTSVGTIVLIWSYKTLRQRPARVELIARAPEKGNWSPQTIHVEKDKEVTLVIRNADVVTHGFYLPEYKLVLNEIKAGEVKKLTFRPQLEGEFTFYCSVWCSDYHMHMRGTMVVD